MSRIFSRNGRDRFVRAARKAGFIKMPFWIAHRPAPPVTAGTVNRFEKDHRHLSQFSMLYLVTFTCYGSHLPGDARGSFDHVRRGERAVIGSNPALEAYRRQKMRQALYCLETAAARSVVRDAIVEVCSHRCWSLHALHVRTSHVHGIVEVEACASRIVNDWKAYATRALRAASEGSVDRLYWTHGGSARKILTSVELVNAMRYVLEGQGEPMERYCAPRP